MIYFCDRDAVAIRLGFLGVEESGFKWEEHRRHSVVASPNT
jgi:hypothetical protein